MGQDQPTNGKITIKLDQKTNTFPVVKKEKAKDLLENIQKETAAATEEVNPEFEWILPVHEPEPKPIKKHISESKKISYGSSTSKEKKGNPLQTASSLLFSIAFAIGLGIAFGLILLRFISADDPAVVGTENSVKQNNPSNEQTQQAETAKTAALTLPALNTYVVQSGMFSNLTAAQERMSSLKEKGIPSLILQQEGQAFVFIGVASSEAEAKQLAGLYATKGAEVYAKPYQLHEKTLQEVNSDHAAILSQTMEVLPVLTDIAGKMSLGQGLADDQITDIHSIQTSLQTIQSDHAIISGITEVLVQSNQLIERYNQSSDPLLATDLQALLLSYLQLQQEI